MAGILYPASRLVYKRPRAIGYYAPRRSSCRSLRGLRDEGTDSMSSGVSFTMAECQLAQERWTCAGGYDAGVNGSARCAPPIPDAKVVTRLLLSTLLCSSHEGPPPTTQSVRTYSADRLVTDCR